MMKLQLVRFVAVAMFLVALGVLGAGDTKLQAQTSEDTVDACVYVGMGIISQMFPGFGMIDTFFPVLEGVNERSGDCTAAPPLLAASRILGDEHLPAIRHLLTQGANVKLIVDAADAPFVDDPRLLGGTALHMAAMGSNRTSVLDMLIEFGADVAAGTVGGAVPLHFAAAKGDPDMVELLLERGSDVNATDERGWTPLHYAARESESEEVVIALVDLAGANLEATTNSGQTAYDLILANPVLKDTEAAYLLEGR